MNGSDKLLGVVLNDDFRVVRQIGFGGYAKVYAAEQLSVGRRIVAIKVLHAMHGDISAAVAGLKREAAYLALLRSYCFPRIFRTGATPEGLPYFVMELVSGRALDVAIKESGPLSLEDAAPVLDSLMEGIAEMHSKEIIHRDIKAGNVILEEDAGFGARVKMLDLGSAKSAHEADQPIAAANQLSIGSPPYLAPETAIAGTTSEFSDIYSLGALAYETLCGIRALHLKETNPESYYDYLRSDKAIPTYRVGTIQPNIPEAVEEVIHRALARKPQDRWSSVAEFRSAFFHAVQPCIGLGADKLLLRAAGVHGNHNERCSRSKNSGGLKAILPLRFRKR